MDVLTAGRGKAGRSRPGIILRIVLLTALTAVCASVLLQPLMDYDFFWHLKTGEWIWEHRALIRGEDPFSYTAPRPLGEAQRFSTTAYWLSQILLHLVERAAGLGGIVALRIALFLLLLWVMWLRREGDMTTYLALMTLMAFTLAPFPFERPQAASFIFFAFLLRLLERLRAATIDGVFPRKTAAACVAVMLAWANMHPGFILGVTAIGLHFAEASVRRLRKAGGEMGNRAFPALAATLVAAAGVTLMNPNGWQVLQVMRLPAWMISNTTEYKSTVWVYLTVGSKPILGYWLVLLATATVVAVCWHSSTFAETALLLGTGYFSFVQVRYIAFFLILALPVTGRCLARAQLGKWARPVVRIAALAACGYMILFWKPHPGQFFRGRWVDSSTLPVEAADFVLAADLTGRMYNYYSWGGYLMWRLGPERQVFIDGRNLSQAARIQSGELDSGRADQVGGRSHWSRLLDQWGVNWVIVPIFNTDGSLLPLPSYLGDDSRWDPIFMGGNAAVFVRHILVNARVIELYAQDKVDVARRLLPVVDEYLARRPGHAPSLVARGDLLVRLNRIPEARDAYARAAEAAPRNPELRDRLKLKAPTTSNQ